jgi:hypothetical protein
VECVESPYAGGCPARLQRDRNLAFAMTRDRGGVEKGHRSSARPGRCFGERRPREGSAHHQAVGIGSYDQRPTTEGRAMKHKTAKPLRQAKNLLGRDLFTKERAKILARLKLAGLRVVPTVGA